MRTLEFGVSDEQAWSVGLACGGRIEVFVEPVPEAMRPETLTALNEARRAGRAIVRATDLATGEDMLIDPATDTSPPGNCRRECGARRSKRAGGNRRAATGFSPSSIRRSIWRSSARCISPSRWHRWRRLAGYGVRIIDPRTAFATAERFPGVALQP